MDAVGGDQQGAVVTPCGFSGGPVDEVGANALGSFRPPGDMMTGENVVGAQPFGHGIEQDLLQFTAMDRELRPFVAGLQPARFAPDRLAVLGEERQLARAHAAGVQFVEQAEFDQLAHRMRQHIDTDAERL